MKPLTTLLLYSLLALCLGLFGYSVWQGLAGGSASPAESAAATIPAPVVVPETVPETAPENVLTTAPEAVAEPLTDAPADAAEAPGIEVPPETAPGLAAPAGSQRLPADDGTVRVAIIIDDVGYNLTSGRQLAELPAALTLAVLPHSPHGVELAELAHQRGKEIMLHVPMSTEVPRQLDVGGLTGEMNQQEFERTLDGNLASIPHVRGLNNHMGSRLTRQPQPMQWLMNVLAEEQLFFIDSRTTAASVALQTAEDFQVPTRKRDVFLDNSRALADMQHEFDRLILLAQRQGSAIAIGHPYPETVTFLRQALPQLAARGIELVPVSQLLPRTASQKTVESAATRRDAHTSDL